MPKEYHIFGKNLTHKEAQKSACYLERAENESRRFLAGELIKTDEELKFIAKIKSYLKKEFENLEIEREPEIIPEQIHILSREAFCRHFPNEINGAFCNSLTGAIYINKSSRPNRLALYKTIFHEILESVSFKKYYADIKRKIITVSRVGQAVQNTQEKGHEHFRGLKEAIIDKTIFEIFSKNKEDIKQELSIAPEEEKLPIYAYDDYIEILNIIIQGIADKTHTGENIIWRKFKKGLFTGEMMYLREIEKTFGKGALRVVAAIDSATKNMPEKEITEKMIQYFKSDNKIEKNKLANDILIERERLKYNQSQL